MKYIYFVLLGFLCSCNQQGATSTSPFPSYGNQTFPYVGKLGLAYGTVVKINAEVVEVDETQCKGGSVSTYLQVTSVNGVKLHSPVLCDYVANSSYGKSVSREIYAFAYETGRYEGIPPGVPSDIMWQDVGFHFASTVVLLKELTE